MSLTISRRPRSASAQPTERSTSDALLERLESVLESEGVRYCQWKGNWNHARWSSGEGDLDLLVDDAGAAALVAIADRLGFRVCAPGGSGAWDHVASYIGYDPALEHLVHVHAYRRLSIGCAWWREFHLPIEALVLDSATRGERFRAPSPELELLLMTLDATLRHGWRDGARFSRVDPLGRARPRFADLIAHVDRAALDRVLAVHLSPLQAADFDRYLAALAPRSPTVLRLAARAHLEWRLRQRAERNAGAAMGRRLVRHASDMLGVRAVAGARGRKRLRTSAVIAFEGADGAGKSTCAGALAQWLGRELLVTHAHLGLPDRSPATLAVGGMLKASRLMDRAMRRDASWPSATLALLRCVCRARDRARIARRVHAFASSGGLAICERYPVPENRDIAGPGGARGLAARARGSLADWLRARETRYYDELPLPHVVLLLRVDPETAVRRKRDEPSSYVRERAEHVLHIDWSRRRVREIDAERPLSEVLAGLRAQVWEAL